MSLRRRDFIKLGGAGLALAGLDPERFFASPRPLPQPASPFAEQLLNDEFPFPYDEIVFECAERISNIRRGAVDPSLWRTNLNLLIREGRTLDVKVLVADRREDLSRPRETLTFTGVQGSLDAELRGYDSSRLHYQVQYREGQGAWKWLPPRSFKLPNVNLQTGGQVQALFIGDDHAFDDADAVVTPDLRQTKITGDFFCDFLRNLKADPKWLPSTALSRMTNSLSLAKATRTILMNEDPDVFINLGDSTGIGSEYRWENWGLPFKNLTDKDYDYIARTLWFRMRKAFSGLTPNMPTLMALGNHDGDEGYNPARFKAKAWRQKLFPFPDATTYPEGGHPEGNYYAFTLGADANNRGGVQFIFLDVMGAMTALPRRVEDWTLGADQLNWLGSVLDRNDHEWSFACLHHVLGGWPAAPDERDIRMIAYGRGPLFTAKDYAGYGDAAKIEQVTLTELARNSRVRAFIYGHDHIFKATRVGGGTTLSDLYGVCAGSTKALSETDWWQGARWQKHYGSAFKPSPDFYGPSGVTRLEVKRDQARFDFIPTGRALSTNLPAGTIEGAPLASAVLVNPAPSIVVDKPSFMLQAAETTAASPSQNFRVRNGGGQGLSFTAKPQQSWIKVSPESGVSWGGWVDIAATLFPKNMKPGTYDGTISIESPGAANSPVQITVQMVIQETRLYPPLDFSGKRISGALTLTRNDNILLTWKENRLNTIAAKYRLFLLDDAGGRNRIGEVRSGVASFLFKRAAKDKAFRFGICAVDGRNREGETAVTTVRPR